jgi:hypothetical protein
MKYTDLTCLCCGRKFTTEGPQDWDDAPPSEGLLFIARGNYGSTVYDPPPGHEEYLLVVICDQCILDAAGKQNVMHVVHWRQPRPVRVGTREPWDPGEE